MRTYENKNMNINLKALTAIYMKICIVQYFLLYGIRNMNTSLILIIYARNLPELCLASLSSPLSPYICQQLKLLKM